MTTDPGPASNVIQFPLRPVRRRRRALRRQGAYITDQTNSDGWTSFEEMWADVGEALLCKALRPDAIAVLVVNQDNTTTVFRRGLTRTELRVLFEEYIEAVPD